MSKQIQDFIKRATKVTAFNLVTNDFTSTTFKVPIQELYARHMFLSFSPDKALTTLTVDGYNKLVRQLKQDDKEQYEKLHNLQLTGVGPAEAVLYLLTKNGRLGGGGSGGVDLIDGVNKYEVKAAKWKSKTTKDSVIDFKLGGNIPGMSQLEVDIQDLAYNLGLARQGAPEIKESFFKEMKKIATDQYDVLEKRYQQLAGKYFGDHETIFIQTEKNQPDFGEILAIKGVKPKDIFMERFTSKSIKPIIKIK